MTFKDFKPNEPAGSPYLHMNFDAKWSWDTKVCIEGGFKN